MAQHQNLRATTIPSVANAGGARTSPKSSTLVPVAAGVCTTAVGAALLRHGIVPHYDTVSYWSAARAVADGHLFTTTLNLAFSEFLAADFLQRGGRVPFVDFPLGYPTLAGGLAVFVGARQAMALITVGSLGALGWLIARGPAAHTHMPTMVMRALVAVGVAMLPITLLVAKGALSEPLFLALVVGLVGALVRYRTSGRGWPVVVALGASVGLVRFVGASLTVLIGWERFRRTGRARSAIGWTAATLAPTLANVAWAAAQGGGHRPGWRGVHWLDLKWFARSISGWLDAAHGHPMIFIPPSPPWWAWLVVAAWLLAVAWAVAGLAGFVARRPPAPLELSLAAAGLLTLGLWVGMATFDAFVSADNRQMLPAGVLTIVGLAWSVELGERSRRVFAAWAVLGAWVLLAVRPFDPSLRPTGPGARPVYAEVAAASGASIVITNDADGIHWHTGLPATYPPMSMKALTGEAVDVAAAYRALPCPMWEHDGVLIIADNLFSGISDPETLEALVAEGRLSAEPFPGGVLYRPTPAACDS